MDSALELIVGKNGMIVGFGLSERDVVSEQLKQATIGVVDPYTCIASDRTVYGTHLTLDMFCGKGQNGVSACNGDSGGGMFFEVSGRWFVRGLVSFTPARGSSGLCDPLKYTVYTDVAQYVEWIKQYVDQRVIPVESEVLEVDYEEKLRLFNFDTCDNIALIELLSPADTSQPNVQPICMPVTPELRTNAKTNLYVASSDWAPRTAINLPVRYMEPDECTRQYAEKHIMLNLLNKRLCAVIVKDGKKFCSRLASGAPLQEMKMFGGKEQYFLRGFELAGLACRSRTPQVYSNIEAYVDWILYNMRRYLIQGHDEHTQIVEIKKIIFPPPDHPRQLFALIELLEPADLTNPYIKPICLPFMDGLHRNKPAEIILFSLNFINSHEIKKLKMTDFQKCQQRLFHLGQPITLNTDASCAVEDFKTFHQKSLFSKPGSPYLVRVPYEDGPRYFLYGMHVDDSYYLSRLSHGPYIFHKIEQTDLAWILENVRENERQSSYPSLIRNERVHVKPVEFDAAESTLFNFATCGVSSDIYPIPWLGLIFSGRRPYGYVILISDRYVVGPVYHCNDADKEYVYGLVVCRCTSNVIKSCFSGADLMLFLVVVFTPKNKSVCEQTTRNHATFLSKS
uniref:Peptidase S1 domain-containing protein n=1 Tax=Anopheles melas TaxID=34690 RepID=A0A182U6R7_9DIPT